MKNGGGGGGGGVGGGGGENLSKWLGFVAAIWVQAIAGNNYGFSNYSVALKAVGGYNQVELNNLGVAKDVGKALGVLAGLASDFLPPSTILLLGSIEGLVGYGIQWAVLSSRISPPPYWQMCAVLCMGGNSTTWMNTAVLVTCVRNFCRNRGPVVGILKGYIGLSTAIFTVLCSSLFSNDPAAFVLMLATVPFVVCIVAMVLMRPSPPAETRSELESEKRNFHLLNAAATVLALYILLYDYVGAAASLSAARVWAGVLLVLLAVPLYVPLRFMLHGWQPGKTEVEKHTGAADLEEGPASLTQPLTIDDADSASSDRPSASASSSNVLGDDEAANEADDKQVARCPELGEDHTPWQAFMKAEFWVLFITMLFGMGTGTVIINNLGQIGQTLGYKDVSSFVSLTSVWGFFGRIGSGMASEHYLRSSGVPRPTWLAASQLLSIVGYGVLLLAFPGSLYIGSSIIGLTYGVRLAVTVPTVSELFGLKFFGLFYNILIINIPLGSFFFSGLLAGLLYDMEADKSSDVSKASGAPVCLGTHCFRLTFIVMVAVCIVGFVLDLLLAFITRPVYRKLQLNLRKKLAVS